MATNSSKNERADLTGLIGLRLIANGLDQFPNCLTVVSDRLFGHASVRAHPVSEPRHEGDLCTIVIAPMLCDLSVVKKRHPSPGSSIVNGASTVPRVPAQRFEVFPIGVQMRLAKRLCRQALGLSP
jgi:hypothetical protein